MITKITMNTKVIKILFLQAVLVLGGCVHFHKVQDLEENAKIPTGIKVAIGSTEVNVGDRVEVFRATCTKSFKPRSFGKKTCKDTLVGQASVVQILDNRFSIVSPEEGVAIEDDMYVEKMP